MSTAKEEIINDINKHGFPAEIVVCNLLDKDNWMVYPGVLFFDEDESKDRELDIHAVKVDINLPLPKICSIEYKAISHLIIEVKKIKNPVVFFKYGKSDLYSLPIQMLKSDEERFHHLNFKPIKCVYQVGNYKYSKSESLEKYGMNEHRFKSMQLHKTFFTAFTNPEQNNAIFGAIKKTGKALKYIREKYGTGPGTIHIFNPVIVVEGTLWSASVDINSKVSVEKVEHLLVEVNELVPSKDAAKYEETQVYDVVTRVGFESFLKQIKKDDKNIYYTWKKYLSRVKKS